MPLVGDEYIPPGHAVARVYDEFRSKFKVDIRKLSRKEALRLADRRLERLDRRVERGTFRQKVRAIRHRQYLRSARTMVEKYGIFEKIKPVRTRWTSEMKSFLKARVGERSNISLRETINKKFGTSLTKSAIASQKYGLRKKKSK